MKIAIYDPLFSEYGHFYRYSKFICTLLNNIESIDEIIVYAEVEKLFTVKEINPQKITVNRIDSSIRNLQTNSIQSSFFDKVCLYFKAYKNYSRIIKQINLANPDYVIFLSQGQLPFWIALRKLKCKSIISSISIKWLYVRGLADQINNHFFKKTLKSATRVMFTEDIYNLKAIQCGIQTGFIFPDRFLPFQKNKTSKENRQNNLVQLVTLGTVAKGKSPENFVKEFIGAEPNVKAQYNYIIAGKDLDNSMENISEQVSTTPEISFINDYLDSDDFNRLIENADFVVIPYSEDYTKYATSGIMWDCFEKRIPILCPDIELFNFYIDKYNIGYTYNYDKLNNTLSKILEERTQFRNEIDQNYNNLVNDYNKTILTKKFKKLLHE